MPGYGSPMEHLDASHLVEYSFDHARIDIARVHGWLRGAYWCPNIRRDILEKAFANSVCIGAYDVATSEQVGFARIVTDSATFSYLADVHVEVSHRGKGIGRELVTRLMQHSANDTVRTICLATQDAHEVYRPLGFTETQPGRYMIFRADEQKWQEKSGT